MNRTVGLTFILPGLMFIFSCGPEKKVKANLSKHTKTLDLQWIAGPEVGRPEKNQVRVSLPNGFEDYTVVQAGIYMRIHGHGGDDQDIRIARDQSKQGVWIVSHFSFTMNGPWEFSVKAESPDGSETEFWEVPVQVR